MKCKCNKCDVVESRKGDIENYFTVDHIRKSGLKCKTCNKVYEARKSLNRHIRNKHGKKGNCLYNCTQPNCKYGTDNRSYTDSHLVAKHKIAPAEELPCRFNCGKNFSTVHLKVKHERYSMCNKKQKFQMCILFKDFQTSSTQGSHVLKYHQQEIATFKCRICKKQCTSLDNRNINMKWHKNLVLLKFARLKQGAKDITRSCPPKIVVK